MAELAAKTWSKKRGVLLRELSGAACGPEPVGQQLGEGVEERPAGRTASVASRISPRWDPGHPALPQYGFELHISRRAGQSGGGKQACSLSVRLCRLRAAVIPHP